MKTVRILSINSDGMRDLIPLYFMSKFVNDAGITNVFSSFDIIVGSGFGAINALGFATGNSTADLISFFTTQGPIIFASRPSNATKVSDMNNGVPIYSNTNLISSINALFGNNYMPSVKTNVLIPSYYQNTATTTNKYNQTGSVLFSNLTFPNYYGNSWKVANVATASAMMPIYFAPISTLPSLFPDTPMEYSGGSIYQSNPAQLAYALSTALFPTANRIAILSLGTGRGDLGFTLPIPSGGESMYYLNDCLNFASSAGSQAVHNSLYLQSQYGVKVNNKDLFYYGFDPYLDNTVDTEVDNSTSGFIAYMNSLVTTEYAAQIQQIYAFIQNAGFN